MLGKLTYLRCLDEGQSQGELTPYTTSGSPGGRQREEGRSRPEQMRQVTTVSLHLHPRARELEVQCGATDREHCPLPTQNVPTSIWVSPRSPNPKEYSCVGTPHFELRHILLLCRPPPCPTSHTLAQLKLLLAQLKPCLPPARSHCLPSGAPHTLPFIPCLPHNSIPHSVRDLMTCLMAHVYMGVSSRRARSEMLQRALSH